MFSLPSTSSDLKVPIVYNRTRTLTLKSILEQLWLLFDKSELWVKRGDPSIFNVTMMEQSFVSWLVFTSYTDYHQHAPLVISAYKGTTNERFLKTRTQDLVSKPVRIVFFFRNSWKPRSEIHDVKQPEGYELPSCHLKITTGKFYPFRKPGIDLLYININ